MTESTTAPPETLYAVTQDGKDVILHPNGGWAFRKPGEAMLAPEPFTFRRTRWGQAPADVQASESGELVKASEEGLIFKDRISKFACLIAYFFAKGRLVRAKYNLLVEHALSSEYLADFDFLQGILQKKYG